MQHGNIIRAVLGSHPEHDWLSATRRGITTYYHQQDTDLRLEVGYDDDDVHTRDFIEPWANGFPNPKATSYYAYLYYGATLIEDFIVVYVDGGRLALPLPQNGTNDVPQLRYRIAQIIDGGGALDQYMKQAGLIVAP
jgi:hypothetical protein